MKPSNLAKLFCQVIALVIFLLVAGTGHAESISSEQYQRLSASKSRLETMLKSHKEATASMKFLADYSEVHGNLEIYQLMVKVNFTVMTTLIGAVSDFHDAMEPFMKIKPEEVETTLGLGVQIYSNNATEYLQSLGDIMSEISRTNDQIEENTNQMAGISIELLQAESILADLAKKRLLADYFSQARSLNQLSEDLNEVLKNEMETASRLISIFSSFRPSS